MKYQTQKIFTLFLLIFLTSGCDLWDVSGSKKDPMLYIRTDKEVYNPQKDEMIRIEITNYSDISLHYNTCFPQVLEVLNQDAEITTVKHFPICYCLCLTTLEPGKTVPAKISRIDLKTLVHFHPSLSEYPDAVFRVRFDFSLDRQWKNPLPADYTRSNTFELTGFKEAESGIE